MAEHPEKTAVRLYQGDAQIGHSEEAGLLLLCQDYAREVCEPAQTQPMDLPINCFYRHQALALYRGALGKVVPW